MHLSSVNKSFSSFIPSQIQSSGKALAGFISEAFSKYTGLQAPSLKSFKSNLIPGALALAVCAIYFYISRGSKPPVDQFIKDMSMYPFSKHPTSVNVVRAILLSPDKTRELLDKTSSNLRRGGRNQLMEMAPSADVEVFKILIDKIKLTEEEFSEIVYSASFDWGEDMPPFYSRVIARQEKLDFILSNYKKDDLLFSFEEPNPYLDHYLLSTTLISFNEILDGGAGIRNIEIKTIECLARLVDFGVDPNAKDKEGETAIQTAYRNNDLKRMEVLLRMGANPLVRNWLGDNVDMTQFPDIPKFKNA